MGKENDLLAVIPHLLFPFLSFRRSHHQIVGHPGKGAVSDQKTGESLGLLQDELNYCDVLITIPASEEYPILNLSHATHTVLYEFFMAMHTEPRRPEPADKREKEMMFAYFGDLLDAIDYPKERRPYTSIMFRRMMGRAIPTKYEYNTLMGVFGDAAKYLKYGKSWKKDKSE